MSNQKKRVLPGNNGVTATCQRFKGGVSSNGEVDKCKAKNLEGNPELQPRKGKLRGARERSPCSSESSTPEKNGCSKMPFMRYLKSKIDAAGSVLGKTKKQRAKQDCEGSLPAVGYDYDAVECDLISCEQDLSELNLLPEGFSPGTPTILLTAKPKNSPTCSIGQFNSFDGSRFSPMEEASLVLEDASANANLVESSRNASEEIIGLHDGKVDSMLLALQLGDQSSSDDWSSFNRSSASGSTSGESCFNSSCSSTSIKSEANLGDSNTLSLHWECDRKACSDLQELDLGKNLNEMSSHLFENEANKVAEELVAKAVNSGEHSRSCSFDDTLLCEYNERRGSFCPLEQSLLQLDDVNGEGTHDPLFWPFNPNSYFSDEYNFDRSLYKMDSNSKQKTPSPEGLTSKPLRSKLGNVSKKKSDCRSSASKKASPKDRACDLKEQTTIDKSISRMSKASNLKRLALLSDDNTLSKNFVTPVSRKLSTDSTAGRLCKNIPSEPCKSMNGSMYSNSYLSSANNQWKVVADQLLANFPETQTECFVTADDSIEFLLGMKEFDGQEGLEGTVNEEQDFQDLQSYPKYKATKGLLNAGNQDYNFMIEDKFEKVGKPVCCAMENRFLEGTAKTLQGTSTYILEEGMVGTCLNISEVIEEIKTIVHMDRDNNPIVNLLPTTIISFPEKKLKSFEYISQDAKNLAPCDDVGMERKVEALEAELSEVKMQNKKLERLLKCVVRKTNTMEKSLHNRKLCLYGRRPACCKFAFHQRRKRKVYRYAAICKCI